jgi:hypothetical protein
MIVAVIALVATAAIAWAHDETFASDVGIKFKAGHGGAADTFSGDVTSVKKPCIHRRIRLLKRNGDTSERVASDRTDKAGHWEIQMTPAPSGTYFAKATAKILADSQAHHHVCAAATSKDVKVH